MSYKLTEILTDLNGKPIPQRYNVQTGKFEPETNGTQQKVSGNLTVTDANVKAELALIKQQNIDLNTKLDSVIKNGRLQSDTQVTGSNVEQKVFDNLAVSTVNHFSSEIDISNLKNGFTLYVRNQHDQPCSIGLLSPAGVSIGSGFLASKENTQISLPVPANSLRIAISSKDVNLLTTPLTKIRIGLTFSKLPTTGAITLSIIGGA